MSPVRPLAFLILAAGALVACASNTAVVRPSAALGVVLYSDDDYAALKTHGVSVDDLAASLLSTNTTKLAPQTKVEVQRTEQLPVASGVSAPVQWPFERVRVVSGPATGREGWISTRQVTDGQPALEAAK
jgi:hypothetical protein